jgi:GntR family transcriptional regulator
MSLARKSATLLEELRLDHKSPLPLHAQAEQLLRQLVLRPEYTQGGLLPDEVSLSRSLGISRNTLRAAIGRLVNEGRLERKAGVGTRVSEPKVLSGIGAWHSFTKEMAAKGVQVETYSVEVKLVQAPVEAAKALQVEAQTEVLRLDRVRGWNGQSEVDFRSYLHPRLRLSRSDDFRRPLYELIRECSSIIPNESLEELSAVPAEKRLARRLGIRVGTPLLRRERTVLDTGRRPVEFALVHYRCDRFCLALNLRKE